MSVGLLKILFRFGSAGGFEPQIVNVTRALSKVEDSLCGEPTFRRHIGSRVRVCGKYSIQRVAEQKDIPAITEELCRAPRQTASASTSAAETDIIESSMTPNLTEPY